VEPDDAGGIGTAGVVDFELSDPLALLGVCGALAGFSAGVLTPDFAPLLLVELPDALDVLPGTTGPVAVVLPAFEEPAKPLPGVDNTLTARMQSKIQNAATPIVIRVNRSPAFAPNALWPPMPPSAPASPPPRPRCSKTMRIKNAAVKISKNPKMNPMIDFPREMMNWPENFGRGPGSVGGPVTIA
jgi:hypothetical protein